MCWAPLEHTRTGSTRNCHCKKLGAHLNNRNILQMVISFYNGIKIYWLCPQFVILALLSAIGKLHIVFIETLGFKVTFHLFKRQLYSMLFETSSFLFGASGPGCSKLTTSLVNVSLKFQTLISNICQYFLLKKCEKLLQCKSFSHFFNKKYQCI